MTTKKQGKSSDDSLPKFFKVYLPGDSGDDLELPISINRCLPESLPKTVTIRSIYGKFWKIVLRKCSGDVEKYVLVNGWKRIVKDEVLKGGDFLVFEFDGSHCFNFCIYKHGTMCKRLGTRSLQREEVKMESDGEDETRTSDDTIGLDEDEDDDSEDADDDAFEDDDDDVESVDAADDDDDDERKYLDDRENPCFPLNPNLKKISQLLIPSRVIKDYALNFPESITIVDPLLKKFGTLEKKIKIQTNGSVFVKGFSSIIRRNKLKTTDTMMICEIKKTGNHNLVQTIKIHVIRG